jgi:hypothetical protein
MDKSEIKAALEQMVDELAAIEHERWSRWQRYLHSKGQRLPDGSLLIPADFVERWDRQIATPYAALSDDEKESDREQVRTYIPAIASRLAER